MTKNKTIVKSLAISPLVLLFIITGAFTLLHQCKKTPLFAIEGATLVISTDKTYLRTGGDQAIITVLGFNAEGEAMHDHTSVIFSATMGQIQPVEVELQDGRATVTFISGNQGGTADIHARSGSITAEPDPLQLTIGSAALENITIGATPSTLPAGGGQTRIQVAAFDSGNNLLANIPIILSTTAGQFLPSQSIYYTNNLGLVEVNLSTTTNATVKAESGNKSTQVEIKVEETIENQPPTASFTYSPTSPVRGEKVFFNASPSTDPDGTIISWEWDFGDGKTGSGMTIQHKFGWQGQTTRTFQVILRVTDNKNTTTVSTPQTITVQPETTNQLPTADFNYSPSTPQSNETIYFNGGLSTDPDGSIVSWQWNFGDGSTAQGETVNHIYHLNNSTNKTFRVVLTVTDNDGGTDTDEADVTVSGQEENKSPEARFTFSPATRYKNEPVYFNASQSSDPDGTIISWEWDFGDGSTGSGKTISHIYNWTGTGNRTFNVLLTVTDNNHASHSIAHDVSILEEPENQPPTANFTYSPTSPVKNELITFNATSSSDSDGNIVSWQWDFGDGTSGSGETITHRYDWSESGNRTFIVWLTVTDNSGDSTSISRTFTVSE